MVIVVSPNVIDCLKFDSREGKWESGGREMSEKNELVAEDGGSNVAMMAVVVMGDCSASHVH